MSVNFPTLLTLNVSKKSFENSFVFMTPPPGSAIVSLRITSNDLGSKCNAIDIDVKCP